MNLLRLLLQALNRFIDLGVATVGQQLLILAFVAIAYCVASPTPDDVVGYLLIASALTAAYSIARIGLHHVDVGALVRPQLDTMRRLVRFGVQGEAGNALQALNYRVDQFVLRGFESLAAVGVYAVATSMSEGAFVLANAVALVLMPRLTSADPEEAATMTPVAARTTMMIAAGGSLALAAIAPLLIPFVYGDKFDASVAPLWWLLPGAVALTCSKVLTSYIFSQGQPLVNTLITAISLVATLAADVALIPVFGVQGAACAASIGYGVHLCAALVAYRLISGQPALDAIVPRPADLQLYADAWRGAMARLSRRAPAGAGS
jgi:O-antigen/teichoic acid export membrane protein